MTPTREHREVFPLGHMGLTAALGKLVLREGARLRKLDYRLLLLGSLLPDLIDKPIALLLGIQGRSVAHTLLFSISLTLFLVLPLIVPNLYPKRIAVRLSNPLPILTVGVWTHLLLDRIWEEPSVVLWPFLGVGFPKATFDILLLFRYLLEPYILAGELLGLGVIGFLLLRYRLYTRSNLLRFLRTGTLRATAEGEDAASKKL